MSKTLAREIQDRIKEHIEEHNRAVKDGYEDVASHHQQQAYEACNILRLVDREKATHMRRELRQSGL